MCQRRGRCQRPVARRRDGCLGGWANRVRTSEAMRSQAWAGMWPCARANVRRLSTGLRRGSLPQADEEQGAVHHTVRAVQPVAGARRGDGRSSTLMTETPSMAMRKEREPATASGATAEQDVGQAIPRSENAFARRYTGADLALLVEGDQDGIKGLYPYQRGGLRDSVAGGRHYADHQRGASAAGDPADARPAPEPRRASWSDVSLPPSKFVTETLAAELHAAGILR